jgi:hypothetical protein
VKYCVFLMVQCPREYIKIDLDIAIALSIEKSDHILKSGTRAHQPALNQQGALAEWLTRGPAKLISSEACVRITQASIRYSFCFLEVGHAGDLGKIRKAMQRTATTSPRPSMLFYSLLCNRTCINPIDFVDPINLFCHIASPIPSISIA